MMSIKRWWSRSKIGGGSSAVSDSGSAYRGSTTGGYRKRGSSIFDDSGIPDSASVVSFNVDQSSNAGDSSVFNDSGDDYDHAAAHPRLESVYVKSYPRSTSATELAMSSRDREALSSLSSQNSAKSDPSAVQPPKQSSLENTAIGTNGYSAQPHNNYRQQSPPQSHNTLTQAAEFRQQRKPFHGTNDSLKRRETIDVSCYRIQPQSTSGTAVRKPVESTIVRPNHVGRAATDDDQSLRFSSHREPSTSRRVRNSSASMSDNFASNGSSFRHPSNSDKALPFIVESASPSGGHRVNGSRHDDFSTSSDNSGEFVRRASTGFASTKVSADKSNVFGDRIASFANRPPEVRGSWRDGRLYAKKIPLFTTQFALPNRYQPTQQLAPTTAATTTTTPLNSMRNSALNRSLDSSGFPSSSANAATSPTQKTSSTLSEPFPVPPPRKNRLRMSSRTMDSPVVVQPSNRHSVASVSTAELASLHQLLSFPSSQERPDGKPFAGYANASLNLNDVDAACSESSTSTSSTGYCSDLLTSSYFSTDSSKCNVTGTLFSNKHDTSDESVVTLDDLNTEDEEGESRTSSNITLTKPDVVVLRKTDSESSFRSESGRTSAFSPATGYVAGDLNCLQTRSMTSRSVDVDDSSFQTTTGRSSAARGLVRYGAVDVVVDEDSPMLRAADERCVYRVTGNGHDASCDSVEEGVISTSTQVVDDGKRPFDWLPSVYRNLTNVAVHHSLRGDRKAVVLPLSDCPTVDDVITRILLGENLELEPWLYRLDVKEKTDTDERIVSSTERVETNQDVAQSNLLLEIIRKEVVSVKVMCDVGGGRSRNLLVDLAADNTGYDVIRSAIGRFKLTDTDPSSYGLMIIDKTTRDMKAVVDVALPVCCDEDLEKVYFLLCDKDNLAKGNCVSSAPSVNHNSNNNKSIDDDDVQSVIAVSAFGVASLSDATEQRPDFEEIEQQTAIQLIQASPSASSIDLTSSSPTLTHHQPPRLQRSLSQSRLSVSSPPPIDRSRSPSVGAANAAELIALQSRIRQMENEFAARERHWGERFDCLQRSLERFKALAFCTDTEERMQVLQAEYCEVTTDLRLQEQRVRNCQSHVDKYRESSIWAPDKTEELERQLQNAQSLHSIAAQSHEELLSMLEVAHDEHQRFQRRSQLNLSASVSRLYDVVSATKSRCYMFPLTVGQSGLERFTCTNDESDFLIVDSVDESSALMKGDRIVELNSTSTCSMTAAAFKSLVESAEKPCRLVVVRETNDEPTLLQDLKQWMENLSP